MPRLLVGVVVLAMVAAACSRGGTDDNGTTGGGSSDVDVATSTSAISDPGDGDPTEGNDVEPVRWTPCGGELECGRLAVPLDHADPDSDTVAIELVRVVATGDPADVLGSIVVNPGGPGASGVEQVTGGFRLDSAVLERYNLIGFDPRGVGASTGVDCAWDRSDGPIVDHSPDDEAEIAALDAEMAAVADRCADSGRILEHLGTDQVVQDLDLLRQALGDERFHFYGFSYGTLLGHEYAAAFPDRVGHLVLDGVVDPRLTLDGLLDQQAGAFEELFETMDASCGAGLDGCPDDGVLAAHDRLVARLEAEGPVDGFGQTEAELAALVALYSDSTWPLYAQSLAQADVDGDTSGLAFLADAFTGAVDYTAYAAIVCTDAPAPDDPEAWQAFAERLDGDHPRFGAVIANEVRVCAHWPSDPSPARAAFATTDTPVLVIGNTGDAATPLVNAETMAAELPAAGLVVLDANVHTGYRASRCVQDAVTAYFLDDVVPDRLEC
ncbi:MAG: alpha/beta hydrolase [Actinomycetota bacterium]